MANHLNSNKKNNSKTALSIASAATLGALLQAESQAQGVVGTTFKSVENLNYEIIDGNIVIQTPQGSLVFDASQYFIEGGNVFLSEATLATVESTFVVASSAASATATTAAATTIGAVSGTTILGGLALVGGAAALASGAGGGGSSLPAFSNNSPTIANDLPDVNATAGSNFSFSIPSNTFEDIDNDTLTFTPTTSNGEELPSWLVFDAAAETISGAPPETYSGNLEVNITANDGNGGTVTDTFVIEVAPRPNEAPEVSSIENQTINAELALDFTIPAFTDSDGDSLTYSILLTNGEQVPGWLEFDSTTGKFSGTPPADAVGDISIEVTANDGFGGTASTSFTFTVEARPNTAPTLSTEISDIQGSVGTALNFVLPSNTFSDAEDDPLTYSANADMPSWMSLDSATGNITGTPPLGSQNTYEITITATDDRNASVSDTFQLTVETPPAPEITNSEATANFSETTASSTVFTITGTNIVSWSIEGADAGLATIDADGNISFNADAAALVDFENQSDANGDGSYEITVRGTNGIGESTTKDFSFTVTDVTELPDFITETSYGSSNEGVQSLLSLDDNFSHWEGQGTTNTATNLTYSFQTAGTVIDFFGDSTTLTQNFNSNGQDFIGSVFQNFSDVANITFTEISSQSSASNGGADIRISQASAAELGIPNTVVGLVTGFPDGSAPRENDANGNLFIVSDVLTSDSFTTPYGDERNTVSHELGHALGLDHPFNSTSEQNAGFWPYDDESHTATNSSGQQTGGGHNSSLTDGMLETIMTYNNDYSWAGASTVSTPWELGIYDIAALQHLYGANYETNAGDTTYSYNYDTPVFDVIWDGGGTDTIIHTGDNKALINLNEGQTSHLGSTPNWSVDVAAADLYDDAGATFTNVSLLYEDDGTIVISPDGSFFTFTSNLEYGGTFEVLNFSTQIAGSTNVDDWNIELSSGYIVNTDNTTNFHSSTNVGIAFGVTIENGTGGNGDDTIIGNSANNILIGNDGNDRIEGEGGQDTITGGEGYDSYIFDNGTTSIAENEFGNDVITDFDLVQDTIFIQTEVGADNVTFNDGVLTLGTAGTITLTGIDSLTAGTDYVFI